jgi:hypothetical protein
MDSLQYAVYGVGAIGLLPLAANVISAAITARRKRRAAAIMRRFRDEMGL